MGEVLHAYGSFRKQVGVVLHDSQTTLTIFEGARVIGVAEQLGVGVSHLHKATVAEVPLESSLQSLVIGPAVARHNLVHASVLRVRFQKIALRDGRAAEDSACRNLSIKRIADKVEQLASRESY